MSSPATPELRLQRQSRLQRRHARPWRIAFVIYALATTVATHWPDFQLAPEVPATDKSLHFLAFGGLTWLLWRTRWFDRRVTVMLIAAAWAAIDEITQGVPVVNRHVSGHDLIASELGVVVAAAWLWALRPVGEELNRVRLSRHQYVFDEMFRPPTSWVILVGAMLACALPPLLAWRVLSPMGTARLILIAVTVWALASLALLRSLQVQVAAAVAQERPCFACGRPVGDVAFDALGSARCPHCAAALRNGQWQEPSSPSVSTMARLLIRPVLVAAALSLAIMTPIVVSAALVTLSGQAGFIAALTNVMTGLSAPLVDVIDLAGGLLLLAVGTRVYRLDLSRWFDRVDRCRRCRHDIRATPTTHGIGRCGECGTEFLRDDPEPVVAAEPVAPAEPAEPAEPEAG